MVASWSLSQETAGLNPFTVMTNIFVSEFSEFRENIQGKLNCADVMFKVITEPKAQAKFFCVIGNSVAKVRNEPAKQL